MSGIMTEMRSFWACEIMPGLRVSARKRPPVLRRFLQWIIFGTVWVQLWTDNLDNICLLSLEGGNNPSPMTVESFRAFTDGFNIASPTGQR